MKPGSESRFLAERGEWFASGFFEERKAPVLSRITRGIRRHFENICLPEYTGSVLYPKGREGQFYKPGILGFSYSHSLIYSSANSNAFEEGLSGASDNEKNIWKGIKEELESYPFHPPGYDYQYCLGGAGYTHSISNYGRVLREGFSTYLERVRKGKKKAENEGDAAKAVFYGGMEELLGAVRVLHGKAAEKIENGPDCPARARLLEAFRSVPFRPAGTFFEAVAGANFVFYLDGCDSLGLLDRELDEFFENDLRDGKITRRQAVLLIKELWKNFDYAEGLSVCIGGTRSDGSPSYNALTGVCIEASRKSRRPNLHLRVRQDMPGDLWEKALDTVATGCGMPVFHNEELYLRGLRDARLNILFNEICEYAPAGCAETMVHGKSNVGSLDAGINLLGVLEKSIKRHIVSSPDFKSFLDCYFADLKDSIETMINQTNRDQEMKALYRPQPVRSLLIDDCIDSGVEYNRGGARYNWSVVNVCGLSNVTDSLFSMKKIIYEGKHVSPAGFLDALENNFQGYGELLKKIKMLPKFGNDEDEVDAIAVKTAGFVFEEIRKYACWRGGRFLPGCMMFIIYADAGKNLMASPDGRMRDEPIADSVGPVAGRDKEGPTAVMKSAAKIGHSKAMGTLVLNMRFSPSLFKKASDRKALINLVKAYFLLGGMQVQMNVVDQKVLEDAVSHPEKYSDLIVRVGGYSEYFNKLSRDLQETIIKRTEY